MTLHTLFSAGSIDRNFSLRRDAQTLERLLGHGDTRYVVFWRAQHLNGDDNSVVVTLERIADTLQSEHAIYLGVRNDQHLFAVELDDTLPDGGPTESDFAPPGSMLGMANADDAALLAYAKGMLEWQSRHRYCGVCGTVNRAEEGGFVMTCTNPECGHRSFPRVDPAIIVLVTDEDRCLLGRQARWPEQRFSTIAGFVEPGESMEDAVRREVAEETGVTVAEVHYLGSQPWPFPGAMMIGFHATARTTGIHLHDDELVEAGWYTREHLSAGKIFLPSENSIAFRLIEAWFDQWDGPPLASFKLSKPFGR